MTLNELQMNCVKTLPPYLTRGDETLVSLLGLNNEAGNLAGMYKKTLYEGAELPQKAFVESLSEVIRYVAIAAHAVDVDLESIMKHVAKDCKSKDESDAGDGERK